jgi:hypothetical protein
MIRVQIQLTKEHLEAIKRLASVQGVSSAEVVRQAIDAMIQANPAGDFEERRKRALGIVGKFSSGRSDVSRKHDEYLAEAFSQ